MSRVDWDALRAEHPLADVVRRSGVDLPTNRGDVTVCCPMPGHDDTTPSMVIHLDTDRYHCFGCGAHGDVIQWTRDLHGVSTIDAVRILTRGDQPPMRTTAVARPVTGHDLARPIRSRPERPDLDRTPPPRVQAALDAAWRYYTCPALHQRGVTYLASRRIDVAALEAEAGRAVIGHTPARVDGLTSYLSKHRFTGDELVDAGLASRYPAGHCADFFRHRAILPIHDDTGRLTGLTGRNTTDSGGPKYLNLARTHTYDKSTALYRPSLVTLDRHANVVVCEGTLDTLAIAAQAATSHLSEQYAPVAPCGIALSERQLERILAIHPLPPVLAGDGDPAGGQAIVEWATRAAYVHRETVATVWPDDHDPASWITEHGENGLLAVTRRGCLQPMVSDLRPRHTGEIITRAALDDAMRRGAPINEAAERVFRIGTGLPSAAAQRYVASAAPVLAPALTANGADIRSVDAWRWFTSLDAPETRPVQAEPNHSEHTWAAAAF